MCEQEQHEPIPFLVNCQEAEIEPSAQQAETSCKYDGVAFRELVEEVAGLKDLFVRRLNEDKQKTELIKILKDGMSFAFTEPFISDIILLLDRLDKAANDDFVRSVSEELYGIIHRRGVDRIEVMSKFDPAMNKAVRVTEDTNAHELSVTHIIRNGYTFSGRVLRPAEVVVVKPYRVNTAEQENMTEAN